MALTTLTGAPSVIEAGNNYAFTETFVEFPVGTFSLQFVMQLPGKSPQTFNAGTNGSAFQVNLGNLATPGQYVWAEYVTEISSGQRATAKTGILQVIPDLTQQQPVSTAAQMLANIEMAITNLTQGGFLSVSVNNVSYTRFDIATLIAMRTRLQAEVKREQQTADAFRGIETSGRIDTRFVPTPTGVPFTFKDIGE